MQVVLFCHSLLSDWNHGNAHFLRGVVRELTARGHRVISYESRSAWSVQNLVADHGEQKLQELSRHYPSVKVVRYGKEPLDLDVALDGADLVLVHEWTASDLIQALGKRRARGGTFRLFFHDTHHRSVTAPESMVGYDLSAYDGVLAFGETLREIYVRRGWANRAWTWHEAADTELFYPRQARPPHGQNEQDDLVWIGNFGDEERTAELEAYLFSPVRKLGLSAHVYGVRYPLAARSTLAEAGIEYRGYLPNVQVPNAFAAYKFTVHVPRRPYAEALRGIPTIRVFEALACGIPLVTAPWHDDEGLFRSGDFLMARNPAEMRQHLRALSSDASLRADLAARGLETIRARHTCAHRVDELLRITREVSEASEQTPPTDPQLATAEVR